MGNCEAARWTLLDFYCAQSFGNKRSGSDCELFSSAKYNHVALSWTLADLPCINPNRVSPLCDIGTKQFNLFYCPFEIPFPNLKLCWFYGGQLYSFSYRKMNKGANEITCGDRHVDYSVTISSAAFLLMFCQTGFYLIWPCFCRSNPSGLEYVEYTPKSDLLFLSGSNQISVSVIYSTWVSCVKSSWTYRIFPAVFKRKCDDKFENASAILSWTNTSTFTLA